MTPEVARGVARALDDCVRPQEREARLKLVMAADALRKSANEIERLRSVVCHAAEKHDDISFAVLAENPMSSKEAPRCAECTCEHGGADCNWIKTPENLKEAD